MTKFKPESDPLLLVLNPIRLKGTAELATIAEMSSVPSAEALTHLEQATVEGLVTYREGRRGGYRLTEMGADRHNLLLQVDRADEVRARGLTVAYEGFLPLNAPLKELCTAWQIRPDGTPNHHTDTSYDESVIARLAQLDNSAQEVLAKAGELSHRMGTYGLRLADALRRLQNGDLTAFARPMAASYHDCWMELHQDLLLSLGRSRSEDDGH